MTEEKRGRKSEAELAMVAVVSELPVPMPPPSTLDEAGCDRWIEIVGEHGADRFRKSDRVLLEQLIYCEQLAAKMTAIITAEGAVIGSGSATRYGMPMENPACKIRDRTLEKMMGLQTKLKLCPSTRFRADKGMLQRPKTKVRPWE